METTCSLETIEFHLTPINIYTAIMDKHKLHTKCRNQRYFIHRNEIIYLGVLVPGYLSISIEKVGNDNDTNYLGLCANRGVCCGSMLPSFFPQGWS